MRGRYISLTYLKEDGIKKVYMRENNKGPSPCPLHVPGTPFVPNTGTTVVAISTGGGGGMNSMYPEGETAVC